LHFVRLLYAYQRHLHIIELFNSCRRLLCAAIELVGFFWLYTHDTTTDFMVYSGLATPVNDVKIMDGNTAVPAGTVGEVWLRGPNVMKGYWKDPG